MNAKLLSSAILLAVMILGNASYTTMAQTEITSFHLQFMTVPQKLIHNTDASLLVYAVDNNGNPIPVKIPTISVTSSDPSVIKITDVSSSEFDNSVKVGIHAGKIGTAIVTAAAQGFLSSQVTLEVVGDAYKPEGLLVKAVPSSFSHFGPYKGYVSVQLINFFGNPVPADEDIAINLSSSNPDVVSLDEQITIKSGENFVVKDFTVLNPGITLLQAEVPGKWKESARVAVSQPKTPLQLKLYAAPQIAPALQGAFVYGFVQLQDANGIPIKANKDITVNIISDNIKIRQGTGVIKKGSTQTAIPLKIDSNQDCYEQKVIDEEAGTLAYTERDLAPLNTNFRPCVELTAVSKGFKTQSVLVELRKPITRTDLGSETRFDDPLSKIEPVIFPISIDISTEQLNIEPVANMPLLADGTDEAIAAVQLMEFVDEDGDGKIDLSACEENESPDYALCSQPVITPLDLPIIAESGDEFMMQIKETKVARGDTTALIEAKMGYQAGSTEMIVVAEFFGESFTKLTIAGHGGISLAAEPLISKIMAKTDFPYVVYFKDSDGMSAYSISDMPLSISKIDTPEAEIGTSKTTTEILTIESGMIRKGASTSLLEATSTGKGSSTLTVEGSAKDLVFSTTNTITMTTQLPEKLGLFIPSLILGNAKYTVPLQVLDKNGFPIKTISDAEILFVPSIRDIVSAPAIVSLPKGEYYTTLLIEANNDGKTEITALANNFQSTKLDVEVTSPVPTLTLTPSIDPVRIGNKFTVTLNSEFTGLPVRDLHVKWSSDMARLVEADEVTNEFGSAKATFVMNQASPLVVKAEVSGLGYRPTEVTLNMQAESIGGSEVLVPASEIIEPSNKGVLDMLTSNPYFFLLPAIGGVIFWLVKTERLSLPIGRLLERFRESEE